MIYHLINNNKLIYRLEILQKILICKIRAKIQIHTIKIKTHNKDYINKYN
jgi:hypothetical protein